MGFIVPSDVPRRRFPSGDRFWSQGSYTCRQAVRERYVGPRAHRPYVTYPTIKNRQATMLTWNLCVRPACWILSNQRKPRAWRDKKNLWPGPGIIISDYATCALITEKIASSSMKVELCWLSRYLSIPLTGWLFNLIWYPSKWNKENDRNMNDRETKWNSASNTPREKNM